MSSPDRQKNNIFLSKKTWKKIVLSLVFLVVFEFILYPVPVLASQINEDGQASLLAEEQIVADDDLLILNFLPENGDLLIARSGFFKVTAYSSDVWQTDGDPCRTANGFNLCEHGIEDSVAANFLPFGTKIKMPDVFGDKVFVVRDRMNPRYNDYIDIWFKDREEAKIFGIKVLS